MLKMTAVSYLNTKPFLYGLMNSPLIRHIALELDIPSVCAAKLAERRVDLGLVPVAVLPHIPEYQVISGYCIGADGPVETVCIFSERPIEQVSRLYLDYQSRTSVVLTRILLSEYWQLKPELLPAEPGYIDRIAGETAGLVIGDRAFALHARFPYVYDLSAAWKEMTGLPFVFALWASVRELDPLIISIFDEALKDGIDRVDQLIKILPSVDEQIDLKKYFTQHISYRLDDRKQEALALFFEKWRDLDGIARPRHLR